MNRQEDFDRQADDYSNCCFEEDDSLFAAFHFKEGAEYGYKYAVDKAWGLIEKLCDSHNVVSIKDGKYKSRSWLEEQFRKAMQ